MGDSGKRGAKKSRDELYMLGCAYEDGEGVPRSFDLAHRYYVEAAELGCSDAKFALGCMFQDGVNKDQSQVLYWWLSAAISGHLAAQASLVSTYRSGIPGRNDPDEIEAFAWGNIAICQKETQQNSWSDWRDSFRKFESTLTAEQIRRGEARSIELYAQIQRYKRE